MTIFTLATAPPSSGTTPEIIEDVIFLDELVIEEGAELIVLAGAGTQIRHFNENKKTTITTNSILRVE